MSKDKPKPRVVKGRDVLRDVENAPDIYDTILDLYERRKQEPDPYIAAQLDNEIEILRQAVLHG